MFNHQLNLFKRFVCELFFLFIPLLRQTSNIFVFWLELRTFIKFKFSKTSTDKLDPMTGKIKHLDSRQFNDYVIRRNWLLLFESQFDTRLFLRVTCAQHSSVEHLFSVFLFLLHTTVPVCYISLSPSLSVVCCLFVLYVCGAQCVNVPASIVCMLDVN